MKIKAVGPSEKIDIFLLNYMPLHIQAFCLKSKTLNDKVLNYHCLLNTPQMKPQHSLFLFIQLRTAALRLIVRSWLDVPTFATRRLHACHDARTPSGGRWNYSRNWVTYATISTLVTTPEHPAGEGGTIVEIELLMPLSPQSCIFD
jgi:hypothetical protein